MATIAQTSGRKGFTLIELLVVIAIILILAAIAVPVLARAAAHARDVKCVSNCRQLSQALIQYTGHYDGSFPCCYNTEDGWGEWTKMTWREKILPIVAGNIGELRPEEYRLPEDASIFKCSGRSLWPTPAGVQSIYGVNATPAMIFMDDQGKSIFVVPGYMPPKQFMVTLDFVKEGAWRGKDRKNGEVYDALKAYYLAHGVEIKGAKKKEDSGAAK